MADHGLENRKEDQLITRIATLEDNVKAIRSLQYQGSDSARMEAISVQLATPQTVPSGSTYLDTSVISTDDGTPLIGVLIWSIYEGTPSSANELGKGTSIDDHWIWNVWASWGDSDADHHDAVVYVRAKNLTAGTLTITFGWEMRFFATSGAS